MFFFRILILFFVSLSSAVAVCDNDAAIVNPEFAKLLKLARSGDAVHLRNVAVSYDAGYLTERCYALAYVWYQKAAQLGDNISQDWINRNNKLTALAAGPEFIVMVVPQKLATRVPLVLTSQIAPPVLAQRDKTQEKGYATQLYMDAISGR